MGWRSARAALVAVDPWESAVHGRFERSHRDAVGVSAIDPGAVGDVSEEALQRAVLKLLGLKQFIDNIKSRFAAVQALRS